MISIVVAATKKGVIGSKGRIPWHIKSDLIRLANLTRHNVVILGRKSYASMEDYYSERGVRMPGGHYIVITRDPAYKPISEKAQVAHSIPEAIEQSKALADDAYVIGGSAIFEEILPYTDRIYLTEVDADIPGDAFFPKLDLTQWREVERLTPHDDRDEYPSEQITLDRA